MIVLRILGFVFIFTYFSLSAGEEHQCSRYHYEEQILSKVVRLEHRHELLEDKVTSTTGSICNEKQACCPDGWITFQGSCYLFQRTNADFVSAELLCVEYNAHLVRIESEIENTFLKNHLKDLKEAHYWIGLTDVEKEGTFKWYGYDVGPSFTDWNNGQPDNAGGVQNCGVFNYGMAFKWDDASCAAKFKSVCEKKAD
ncbi:perlucin-like isoform X2 [Mercenaria mercenaria]|uniref:perlucin-like isoform X2 n=1 Tax=Mercenaria mercenaria TaxID=6596 RepID=UPI00234F3827|nr:perlucin-like isoform X2 [Mercenaria mercenaria]